MICMTGDGVTVIVLETGNIEKIKNGRPAKTPDGKIVIAWTPDPIWLADQIVDSDGDVAKIAKAIDEAAKRPQKPIQRPKHKPYTHDFGEKK